MATGGRSFRKETTNDCERTCSQCLQPLRGRNPKLLPHCHHTFCLPCLTDLEASVREKDGPGQGDSQQATFPCPTCGEVVPIPEGGVAGFKADLDVDCHPSPEDGLPSVLCDVCGQDSGQRATHTCRKCRKSLCRSCLGDHDVKMRDHVVTPVGLEQPATEERGQAGLCQVHQDQILCFHCRQCDISICLTCKYTSHEGHETVDMPTAALQARKEINSLIPKTQHQLRVVEASIQRVDREKRELTFQVQDVTQQIHERHDRLMKWARKSRDQLLEEVKVKDATARGQLNAETASSVLTRDTLSMLLARAARSFEADPEVVMWRKELKAALLPEDTLEQHEKRADGQGRIEGCTYDVTDASVIHEDDVRAYLGRVSERVDDEFRRVPVSLRDLANRVEGWMKEVKENTDNLTSQLDACTDDVSKLKAKGDELKKTAEELESKGNELEKKGNELERRGNELEMRGNELEKKANELENKSNDQEKKGKELEEKGNEIEAKTTLLRNEITSCRETERELTRTTQSLKNNLGQGKRLFYACGLDKDSTKEDKAMIFKTTKINHGGHYNKDTGVFTPPINGLYIFTATVEHKLLGSVYGKIMVDGEVICIVESGLYGGSGCVPAWLTTRQRVWLEAWNSGSSYGDSHLSSNFSGTLVLPTL